MDKPRQLWGTDRSNEASNENEDGQGDARSRGVQSVETSVGLLKALAEAGGPLALRDLSSKVDMSPAKVHRYMASFVATGMVDHQRNGAYDLGPAAMDIGLSALSRVNLVNRASDRLIELAELTNATAMLSVWSVDGPVVVRWERARDPLPMMVGVGSFLPMARSATGMAYIAHLPERVALPVIKREDPHFVVDRDAIINEHARNGVFNSTASVLHGFYSLARPILDAQDEAVGVVTLLSPSETLVRPGNAAEEALRTF